MKFTAAKTIEYILYAWSGEHNGEDAYAFDEAIEDCPEHIREAAAKALLESLPEEARRRVTASESSVSGELEKLRDELASAHNALEAKGISRGPLSDRVRELLQSEVAVRENLRAEIRWLIEKYEAGDAERVSHKHERDELHKVCVAANRRLAEAGVESGRLVSRIDELVKERDLFRSSVTEALIKAGYHHPTNAAGAVICIESLAARRDWFQREMKRARKRIAELEEMGAEVKHAADPPETWRKIHLISGIRCLYGITLKRAKAAVDGVVGQYAAEERAKIAEWLGHNGHGPWAKGIEDGEHLRWRKDPPW